jgi:hypothetical protein
VGYAFRSFSFLAKSTQALFAVPFGEMCGVEIHLIRLNGYKRETLSMSNKMAIALNLNTTDNYSDLAKISISINYSAMSYQELRRYFLAHRQDAEALQAYLARRREQSPSIITTVDDPDFDRKIHASVERQMREHQEQSSK